MQSICGRDRGRRCSSTSSMTWAPGTRWSLTWMSKAPSHSSPAHSMQPTLFRVAEGWRVLAQGPTFAAVSFYQGRPLARPATMADPSRRLLLSLLFRFTIFP